MPVDQFIFTDLARGKGLDPNLKGYQVKACSPGISAAEREQLGSFALHFRTSVYENAPKAAQKREEDWRIHTESLDEVPEDVLREFPHVWSYAELGPDRFALMRVRYLGFTHDQRPGNFFAHALVFPPDGLVSHASNPLALSRSNLILENDKTDRTELDPIPDLLEGRGKPDLQMLRKEPYRACLPAMLHAIGRAPLSRQPVVICLDDWRKSAALVEALLMLLPPMARSRTSFCTIEHDRRWPGPQGAGPEPTSPYHLMVLCARDGRPLEIWPNEYEKTYAIFNFVENKCSPAGTVGAYAEFAAKCALDDAGIARLEQHHRLLQDLACGLDRTAWDELVSVVGIKTAQPDRLEEPVRALKAVAQQPEQARTALEIVLPAVESLIRAGKATELKALLADLEPLTAKAPQTTFQLSLREEAIAAFSQGRGAIATALLLACGSVRDEVLAEALRTPFQPASKSDADRTAMVDLRLDGLRLAAPDAPALLALFEVAQDAGRTAQVWKAAGEKSVRDHLAGLAPEGRVPFLRKLANLVPPAQAPDAAIELRLQILDATNPKGEELILALESLAAASAGTDPGRVAQLIAQRLMSLEPPRGVAAGRIAEAARSPELADELFAQYREAIDELAPQQKTECRRQLAAKGGHKTLTREFVTDVSASGESACRAWREKIFCQNEKLLNEARSAIAAKVRAGDIPGEVAEELLHPPASGDGFLALFDAVVHWLPFAPLEHSWKKLLLPPPQGISDRARARLEAMEFLGRLDQESEKDTWSVESFSSARPPWKEARQLAPEDGRKLRDTCLDRIAETGVATPAQAAALLKMLELGGESGPETVAEIVHQLLRKRDEVTCVQAAMAFAAGALDGDKSKPWMALTTAILRKFDRDSRRLFEAHLKNRFHRETPAYKDRLQRLCEAAGFSVPAAPHPAPVPPPKTGDAAAATAGVIGKAKHMISKLWGDSAPEKK